MSSPTTYDQYVADQLRSPAFSRAYRRATARIAEADGAVNGAVSAAIGLVQAAALCVVLTYAYSALMAGGVAWSLYSRARGR